MDHVWISTCRRLIHDDAYGRLCACCGGLGTVVAMMQLLNLGLAAPGDRWCSARPPFLEVPARNSGRGRGYLRYEKNFRRKVLFRTVSISRVGKRVNTSTPQAHAPPDTFRMRRLALCACVGGRSVGAPFLAHSAHSWPISEGVSARVSSQCYAGYFQCMSH